MQTKFFCANLVQKIRIVSLSLSWNLVPRIICICRNQWWCLPLPFLTRNTLFGKMSPKIQNFLFKVKCDTWTSWKMQNSMVLINFSALGCEYTFWVNLVQKIKIVRISWNLVIPIWTIEWWSLFFFVFDRKYRFLGNFFQRINIVC